MDFVSWRISQYEAFSGDWPTDEGLIYFVFNLRRNWVTWACLILSCATYFCVRLTTVSRLDFYIVCFTLMFFLIFFRLMKDVMANSKSYVDPQIHPVQFRDCYEVVVLHATDQPDHPGGDDS